MSSPPTLPNIFEPDEKRVNVKTWGEAISMNADRYNNCFIHRVTHIKNLKSKVFHEYLQIIIQDNDSKYRTRLLVERQTEQDQVILGRWSASKDYRKPNSLSSFAYTKTGADLLSSSYGSSSSGPMGDLPLPLATLTFKGSELSVQAFAKILYKIHSKHPKYNLALYNCYWYSDSVFKALRGLWTCTVESWPFLWTRGILLPVITNSMKVSAKYMQQTRVKMELASRTPEKIDPIQSEFLKLVETDIISSADDWGPERAEEKNNYHRSIGETITDLRVGIPENWDLYLNGGRRIFDEKFVEFAHNSFASKTDKPIQNDQDFAIPEELENFVEAPTKEEKDELREGMFALLGWLAIEMSSERASPPGA